MAEFIVNPRRAPRAPARCRTAVVSSTGSFEAETEDIGARGCQVVSPKGVKKGDAVRLTIANDKVPEPLRVAGRIAWVSAHYPWRVGVAFDDAALPAATAWCERLVAAYPGLRPAQRVPERIALEAMVYLGPPPRFLVDFSADEAALLRAIGSGARVDELMACLHARGSAAERALFSLIARGAVTLVRGQAVHADSWKRILGEIEAALAIESLGTGSPSLAAPPEAAGPAATPVPSATPLPAAPWGMPPQDPSPQIDLHDSGPSLEVVEPAPRGAARSVEAGAAWGQASSAHHPDYAGAGVGWRKPDRARGGDAQAVYDRAHAEFKAGNVNGAIALLRRALALAPGDPEIAEVLGKLAFRNREPGSR